MTSFARRTREATTRLDWLQTPRARNYFNVSCLCPGVAEQAEKQPSSTGAASTEPPPEIVRRKVPQIEIRRLEKMLTGDEANEILSGVVIKKVVVAEKKDQSQSESASEGSAD